MRTVPYFGLLPFLLFLPTAVAQDSQTPPPPVLRITVTLIQLDAVVTDSAGRHVADLKPEEFEVLQDGQPQKLTYFSYVPGGVSPGAVPYSSKATRAGDIVPQGPLPPVTPDEVKRTVALVVDNVALQDFATLYRLREALREYVRRQMQPGDMVALVKSDGGIAALEQFTTDKQLLEESINQLSWRVLGAGLPQIRPFPSTTPGTPNRTTMSDAGYTLAAHAALDALDQVIRGMKGLPGRKSVVFFSDALRMDEGIDRAVDRLTDLANRSGVSLYAVDPVGLQVDQSMFMDQAGLAALAQHTGGIFYSNRNDIAECIREAADDQMGYYLLGYSPQEGTFEKEGQKAKFHKVVVRVARRGLQVRWKSGFNGVPDQTPGTVPASVTEAPTGEEQLLQALASPFRSAGLRLRLTSMFFQNKKTGPVVRSLVHFDGKDLTFTRADDGQWQASLDVVTSAFHGFQIMALKQGGRGILSYHNQHHASLKLSDDAYRVALKSGFVYTMEDPMREPGLFVTRIAVRDSVSGRVGSASQSLRVPDTRKGQLAVSGIALHLATPEFLKSIGTTEDSIPQGGANEEWLEGGPALRKYRPGQNIVYAYQVINPTAKGPAKSPQIAIQIQVRVYRDGRLVYDSPAQQNVTRDGTDPGTYVNGGILSLKEQMTLGEYLLQVVVTDPLAKKKNSQASQWIDFEVTNGEKR